MKIWLYNNKILRLWKEDKFERLIRNNRMIFMVNLIILWQNIIDSLLVRKEKEINIRLIFT